MLKPYDIICESISNTIPFIIHKHQPRSGSLHYDLRFLDPKNSKLLHSFATPSNFLETLNTKTPIVKTRDHDPRWLTLQSYRLETIDKGTVTFKVATSKYFDMIFNGKILNGEYRLFKLSKTFRDDRWLMIRKK